MSKSDFYEILGVTKTASADEIKQAYRKQALQWHPDRNKTPQASQKFKEVTEAFEVLSNPDKKAAYDQFGHAAFDQGGFGRAGPFSGGGGQGSRTYQQGPFSYTYTTGGENPYEDGGFDFGGFSDPFEIFEQFFGGGFGGRRQPKRPVYSLTIDFIDAIKGAEKEIELKDRKMKIKIPAGVDNGSRVRFGEFDIVFEVNSDKKYQRDRDDLYVSYPISFSQAALGDIIKVKTLDREVKLKVLPGTQPNTLVRLKNQGIPNIHTKRPGDLYIRLQVVIPTKLSRDQKELLKQLDEAESSKRSGWF